MRKKTKRQRAIARRRAFVARLSLLLATVIALLVVVIKAVNNNNDNTTDNSSDASYSSNNSSVDEESTPQSKEVTATVLNTGDILIHDNVLWGAEQEDGSYNFSKLFSKANTYVKSADYAVANLEVTLGGTAAGKYRGYPGFNSPDSLLDYLKADGFDMLLTANNHCLDTGLSGMKRTVQQLKSKNLDFLGTKETTNDPTYLVKDINGIKIGMVAFTYGTNASASGADTLINYFSSANLSAFYSEAESVIQSMRDDGAEAIVFYMHWGEEYHTKPNAYQKAVAQQLCNKGVDVIVGGHPHVLQPIELVYAEGSEHTTVCLYSTGNAISNQRISEMTGLCETGHTEDGVLFNYTFTKDENNDVSLTAVDIIPTWVDRYGTAGNYQYTMYPLETADMAYTYGLDDATAKKAEASFERTKKIMVDGLTECQEYLGCEIRFAGETE